MVEKLALSFRQMLRKDNYDIVKIIYLYRYISWLITSIFYIISGPKAPLIYKIIVAISLFIAAKLITNLYIRNKENKKVLKYYVFIETIGITVLLLPTGGISSPFIWYALNPVLVAASFLTFVFSWVNLFFYIASALVMSYVFFNHENITLFELLRSNSNSVLVLLLITLMVGMLSSLTKQLQESKARLEDNLENIMSLYQVVEAFCNQDNLNNFLSSFTEYAVKLTKVKSAFFWLTPNEERASIMAVNNIKKTYDKFNSEIEKLWNNSSDLIKASRIKLGENDFLLVPVKSQSKCFGLIGISVEDSTHLENEKDYIQKLNFLAELSAVVLERFHFEEIANNLLVVDEQNRIANEIHDSVSQRIFSITCALHSIKAHWSSMTEEEIAAEVELLNNAAKNAMKELRYAIYGLSYKKRGEKIFETNIRNYVNEISRLNNIEAKLTIEGDADSLSSGLKKVLHRIIYESAGNAVRHGRCKSLNVSLIIMHDAIKLSIIDNGIGFEADVINNNFGLGIYNIKKMVQTFSGKLDLISKKGEGTKLYISIPINTAIKKEEGAVLENCNSR